MGQVHQWPRRHPAESTETAIAAAARVRRSYSACVTGRCDQGRMPCPTPNVCSVTPQRCAQAYVEAQRQPEAGHAATEIGADQQPGRDPWAWLTLGRFWRLYVAFIAGTLLAVHFVARWPL